MLIWDQHASLAGILWLCVCLGAGMLYQQAPLRDSSPVKVSLLNAGDDGDSQATEEDAPPSPKLQPGAAAAGSR